MSKETTKIDLPPPRMIRRGGNSPLPGWVWILVVAAVIFGAGAGVFFSQKFDHSANRNQTGKENVHLSRVTELHAQARVAVAAGDWLHARELFSEIQILDPENIEARASLPLIDRHLQDAKAKLVVKTIPDGASVTLGGGEAKKSPAVFEGLPLGTHALEISLNGFELLKRDVEISKEGITELPQLTLVRSTGKLKVVSEPRGVEFKVLKAGGNQELKELVEIGKTPATIEELDPGDYKVLMAVEGWPEYSELIRVRQNHNTSVSAVFARGGLNVTSEPIGAEVWVQKEDGPLKKSGATPLTLSDLPVGKHQLELRYEDWSPITRTVNVAEGVTQNLDFSWEPTLVRFESDPPGAEVYLNDKRLGKGRRLTPFAAELPAGDYVFAADHHSLGRVNTPLTVSAEAESNEAFFGFEYGSVKITSTPPGAAVVSNGRPMGRTPLFLPTMAPGTYQFQLSKDQYASSTVSGELEAGGALEFSTTLKFNTKPVQDRNFINGMGQRFTWFGNLNGWVASTEVTQANFERIMGENPSSFKAPNHPVDSVSWYKAASFAEKLTIVERGLGNLPAGYIYRLPTDREWGEYVGRQGLDEAVTSISQRLNSSLPIGSMPPNEYGLFDVRGNVWEWCADWYSQTIVSRTREAGASASPQFVGTERKVLRGGAWNKSNVYDLSIHSRRAARPSSEGNDIGFRVVLMPAK